MQWGQRRTGSAGTERAYGGRVPVLLWAVVLLLEGCQEARPTFSASELHPADRVYTFHHQRIVYAEQYLSPLRISR